jgi:curved DNA-binding protein CbpA
MTDNSNYYGEHDEWKDEENDDDDSSPSLYSILNLGHDATEEEIHRSYRSLSTTFHPDKIRRRPTTSHDGSNSSSNNNLDMEEIQETFLRFKKAHDVLIDPVLRLAYDYYGEDGVELVRRVQQQQREQKTRREDRRNGDEDDDEENDNDNSYEEEYGGDEDDEERMFNLYEKLEDLMVGQKNVAKARHELDKFMEQHNYQQNLTEDNYVHLNVSMTFPPAVPLKPVLYQGRDYLRYVQKNILSKPPVDEEERDYFRQRILQERRLIDYQISQLRSSQKADVGFTLSSVQPPRNIHHHHQRKQQHPIQPSKWSMAVGCSTDLVYPEVAEIANMAKEIESKKKQQEFLRVAQKHPVSAFVNTSYTPSPQTQIFGTANLNNDNASHQYSLGSTHTFSNQTACRYGLTYLARSPLSDDAPIIFNLKSYRHLQNIGTTSVGVSASSSGQMLQWNAKWEGTKNSKKYHLVHKTSVKASIGMLQGNSLELGYNCRFPKPHDEAWKHQAQNKNNNKNVYEWLDENFSLPKKIEVSTVLGHFQKITAMVTHEIASLATHPTLAFGMEHDVSLGRWAWIWEIQYNQSTFRIPISILQLGSVADPRSFYVQKFYHGIYCLLLQSMVADLLGDDDDDHDPYRFDATESSVGETLRNQTNQGGSSAAVVKTKAEAERQQALMKPVAEKKRYRESQLQQLQQSDGGGGGLIILGATYWQKLSQKTNDESDGDGEESWVHEVVSMDATVQLQFWVNKSKLSIPGRLPKSSWMGFYSLPTESKLFRTNNSNHGVPKQRWWSNGRQMIRNLAKRWTQRNETAQTNTPKDSWQDPQLTVRYSFRGSVYEITVGDTESLELPCRDDTAENLGDADLVQ